MPLHEQGKRHLLAADKEPLEQLGIGEVLDSLHIQQRVQMPKDTGQASGHEFGYLGVPRQVSHDGTK